MTAGTASFGAYLLQPIGSDLLVGCGNSPGNEAGCQIFRSADGVSFTHEFAPSEQGSCIDGQLVGSELWVCGHDPDPDDWTLGNIYHRNVAGAWTKIRTLPLTIHALGLWYDGSTIYVAVGAHTGDNATWKGRVLKSVDDGQSWTVADVNNYRCYDVIRFDSRLYAVGYDWTGSEYTNDLHVSSNGGDAWSKVGGVSPASKPRLVLFNGYLVGVQSALNSVFAVASGGAVTLHATPFEIVNQWNVLADGADSYLYALAYNGVWRSADLITWQLYSQISNPIAIALWSGVGLMVSDIGLNARIWKV